MSDLPHELFLFDDLKKGKEYAFDYFFHYYYPGLCAYAQKLLKTPQADAKSVVQDVFVKIWEDRDKINIQSSVRAYLFSSVRNKCLDYLRKKNRFSLSFEDIPEVADEQLETYVFAELELIFHAGLDKLPPKCREVFEMSRFRGLKNREIATELNISEKTVENQMTKALKILRVELKEYLPLLILFPNYLFLK
jgi:RNA polymerase sigma-70 factor, ECF subfamily